MRLKVVKKIKDFWRDFDGLIDGNGGESLGLRHPP